jgi:hypothetical protein
MVSPNLFQTANLVAGSKYRNDVFVPSQGWVFFGGLGNTLTTAQKLTGIDAAWTVGPELYLSQTVYHHCNAQVILSIHCVMDAILLF